MDLVNLNIKHAIKNRLLLEFDYEGKGARIVEPYGYGVTRGGLLGLKAFQIEGHSDSGFTWKLFDLDKATNIKVLCRGFDPVVRSDYKRPDKDMKITYFEI